MIRSGIGILLSVCILFTSATEHSASSGSGKAIYTTSRNPISAYFKEHKNKLRPYFPRPENSQLSSSPYSQGSSTYDDVGEAAHSSDLYSHSNYYDGSSSDNNSIYHSAPSSTLTKEEQSGYMDLYDSLSPETQASNAKYSVMNPLNGGGGNPGYYGAGDPLQGAYNHAPQFHGPGLQLASPSNSAGGNAGYYGTGDMSRPPATSTTHHENSVYSSQHSDSNGNAAYLGSSGTRPHHGNRSPTSNNHNNHNNHDKNSLASENLDVLFPIPGGTGYGENGNDEHGSEYTPYDYSSTFDDSDDDNMLMENPLFGMDNDDTTPASTSATDSSTTDNPLNFLNLVGTDFQPGRLVNIFFGLFIMLFMIIIHGYALWILGIAYLPGTRSLDEWQLDKDKVESICNLVLDAIEYWENKA